MQRPGKGLPPGAKGASKGAAQADEEPHVTDARNIIATCQKELASGPEDLRAARLYYEMGCAYEHPIGDLLRATEHFQKAAEAHAEHIPSLRGARRTLIASRKAKSAAPLFDAEVRVTRDPHARARLMYAKGRLLEDSVSDYAAAREAYRAALELDTANPSILKAIERCNRQTEDWADLSKTLERLAALAEADPAYRAALTANQGRLAAIRADNPSEAMQLYQAALELDPRAATAVTALKQLAREQKQWRSLLAALTLECQQSEDPTVRAAALSRIAAIQVDHLGDVTASVAALEAAAQQAPNDRVLLASLAALYQRLGRHEQLGAVLARMFETSTEKRERLSLAHRVGELAELHLGDAPRARQWYEVALQIDGTFPPVLQALNRLYDEAKDWPAAVALLLAEAAASTDASRRAAAYARVGEIYETQLQQPDMAIKHYSAALGMHAGHAESFMALSRLFAQDQRWSELAELFQRAVDDAPDDALAIAFLFRIGAIQEDQLGDYAGALHAYQQVLDRAPNHLGAVHALQRAAERAGKYDGLVEAIDMERDQTKVPARHAALSCRAAEVLDRHMSDVAGAIRRLTEVIEKDPKHIQALTARGELFHRDGRWEDLRDNHRLLLAVTDTAERASLLHKMGELCEVHLGKDDEAITHYREALEADDGHVLASEALTKLLIKKEAWEDLAKALDKRALARSDPMDKARDAMALGELYEDKLHDVDRALVAYRRAIEAVPTHRPALDARARLFGLKGDWRGLVTCLSEEAQTSVGEAAVVEAMLREGEVRADRLGDLKKAVTAFDAALEKQPGHLGALLALEDLNERLHDKEALLEVYQQQAQSIQDPTIRVDVLREIARLGGTVPGPDGEPQSAYHAILSVLENDEEALTALAHAAWEASEKRLILQYESSLAGIADDPGVAAFHALRVAELLEVEGRPEALDAFRAACESDPDSMMAARGFTRAARTSGDPDALREAGVQEARVTGDSDTAVELFLASATSRRVDGDLAGSVEDLQRALELAPESERVADDITAALSGTGDFPQLITLLGRAADTSDSNERSADLHTRIAALHADQLGDFPAAVASLNRALEALPSHVPALAHLAACLEGTSKWREASEALRKLIAAKPAPEALLDAHVRLATIADEYLQDEATARTSLEYVLKHDADNIAALGRLARIHAKGGDREKALGIAKRLAAKSGDKRQRAHALVDVAHIESALGNAKAAAASLHEAIACLGVEGPAAESYKAMIGTEPEHATWEQYVEALSRFLADSPAESEGVGPAFREMATVQGDRMGQPEAMFATLQQGIETARGDGSLSAELARRLVAAGAHDRAVHELRRAIAVDATAAEPWRLLSATLARLGQADEATAALLPLAVMQTATGEEMALIAQRRARAAGAGPGLLGGAGFRQLQVGGCFESPAATLLSALTEPLRKIYGADLDLYGVSKRDRLGTRSDDAMRVTVDRVAGILGVSGVDLFMHNAAVKDVVVELGNPSILMVPGWMQQISQPQRVFLVARPLASIAREVGAIHKIAPRDLAAVLTAAARLVSPGFGAGAAPEDELDAHQAQISKALSRRSRKAVEEAAAHFAASAVDVQAWVTNVLLTSSRAALLVSDDLVGSLDILERIGGATPATRVDLLQFWCSDAAVRFRRAMG